MRVSCACLLLLPPPLGLVDAAGAGGMAGDALVFGGPSRMLYHGIEGCVKGSSPPWLRMTPGRLNLTFRNCCDSHV